MKKYFFLLVLLQILFILISVSCGSTPPQPETQLQSESPQPPAPEPAPAPVPPAPAVPAGPSQAALNALDSVASRAEEARKRAIDFECPAYFPSDWEAVEAHYAAAGSLPTSTEAEVQQATALLNTVADSYDELFRKTISLYAQAREDEVIAARDELIATGLTRTFPELLRSTDETALSALGQYEAGDYYAARDTAAKALNEYEALSAAARVYLVRQEIIDRNFDKYDPESFYKADEIAWTAIDEFEAGNYGAAENYAEEALLRYSLVLASGRLTHAANLRDSAAAARQRALDLKANIAVRDFFNDADSLYSRAETALRAERYEDAAALYPESEVRFLIAGRDAEEKRRIATEAIREAEETVEASDETARHAEILIEGGSI